MRRLRMRQWNNISLPAWRLECGVVGTRRGGAKARRSAAAVATGQKERETDIMWNGEFACAFLRTLSGFERRLKRAYLATLVAIAI